MAGIAVLNKSAILLLSIFILMGSQLVFSVSYKNEDGDVFVNLYKERSTDGDVWMVGIGMQSWDFIATRLSVDNINYSSHFRKLPDEDNIESDEINRKKINNEAPMISDYENETPSTLMINNIMKFNDNLRFVFGYDSDSALKRQFSVKAFKLSVENKYFISSDGYSMSVNTLLIYDHTHYAYHIWGMEMSDVKGCFMAATHKAHSDDSEIMHFCAVRLKSGRTVSSAVGEMLKKLRDKDGLIEPCGKVHKDDEEKTEQCVKRARDVIHYQPLVELFHQDEG